MKTYKIGNRLVKADSPVEAVKIVKMLDSPNTRVKSRDSWTEVYEKFIEISNKYLPNVSRINSEIAKLYSSHIGEADWEEAYRRWHGRKSRDSEIDELTQEEQQAVEDYREAIRNTSNPKLLKIYSHILEEETEHLQELAEAKEVDDIEDCSSKMKDERLSPMTYKKLKELGVRPEQWKNWTQEEANEYIRNKGQKGSEKKEEKKTASNKTFSITEELAEGETIDDYKQAAKKYGVKLSSDGKKMKIIGSKEAIREYMDKEVGVDIEEEEFSEEDDSDKEADKSDKRLDTQVKTFLKEFKEKYPDKSQFSWGPFGSEFRRSDLDSARQVDEEKLDLLNKIVDKVAPNLDGDIMNGLEGGAITLSKIAYIAKQFGFKSYALEKNQTHTGKYGLVFFD